MPAGHRPQLDSVRFFAFLGVFLFHLDTQRFPYGELGVPLFFALSGFLITRILVRAETGHLGHDLRIFYLRRTLRIFPLYYAVLLALLLFTDELRDPDTGESVAAWYFLYLHNVYVFLFQKATGATTHLWSLCVEEQFYLLFPPVLLLTPARRRGAMLAGLLAASVVARLALYAAFADRRVTPGGLLPVAGEYLLWGALFGLIDTRVGGRPLPTTALLLAGVALHGLTALDQLRLGVLTSLGLWHAYQTLHGVGFALVIFALWRMPENRLVRLLSVGPIVYLGRISYGLYVYHNFLFHVKGPVVSLLPWLEPVPERAFALPATILVSVLSWHLFEAPINRLKDRLPYGRPHREAGPPTTPVGVGGPEGLVAGRFASQA